MAKQQRSRAHKESKGIHGGGGKNPHLTPVEKVLLGGGSLRTIKDSTSKRALKIIAEQESKPKTKIYSSK